jgi:hypothetical protein
MKIFADSATQIDDTAPEPTTGNTRYPDNSSHFPQGFLYELNLNSAVLNGILHRLTGKLAKRLHCNSASIPGLITDRYSRYNSMVEVSNPQYNDSTNYVKSEYLTLFVSSRFKLLKKDSVDDFFSGGRPDTYLSKTEAQRSKGLFFGTECQPYLFRDYPSWEDVPPIDAPGTTAVTNFANLFVLNDARKLNTKLIIPNLDHLQLSLFDIRNTTDTRNGGTLTVYVQFQNTMYFRGVPIPNNVLYPCSGRAFLVLKGTQVYAIYGLQNLPFSLNSSIEEKLQISRINNDRFKTKK